MLKARIMTKTDPAEAWRVNNPILLDGESGYESDTGLQKIGDGIHHWLELTYTNAGSSAVASTAIHAQDSDSLGGSSAASWNKKFDSYVLNSRVEASMSTASAIDKIPTSIAIINWVKAQNFSGPGDIITWEDF